MPTWAREQWHGAARRCGVIVCWVSPLFPGPLVKGQIRNNFLTTKKKRDLILPTRSERDRSRGQAHAAACEQQPWACREGTQQEQEQAFHLAGTIACRLDGAGEGQAGKTGQGLMSSLRPELGSDRLAGTFTCYLAASSKG